MLKVQFESWKLKFTVPCPVQIGWQLTSLCLFTCRSYEVLLDADKRDDTA